CGANLRAIFQMHNARPQPYIPCTSGSQTICGEDGIMCEEGIRRHLQVKPQTSTIPVAQVIGENECVIDQQAPSPDNHGSSPVARGGEECCPREFHTAQACKGIYLESWYELNGAEPYFPR